MWRPRDPFREPFLRRLSRWIFVFCAGVLVVTLASHVIWTLVAPWLPLATFIAMLVLGLWFVFGRRY